MLLKWTELAEVDIEKIEAHIAEDNNSLIAINVAMSIIDSVHLILSEHPRAGRQGRVKNTRELVVNGLPFIVVYRENTRAGCVEILRVLHNAQQWPAAN